MKKRVLSLLLTMVMMVSLLPNAFAAKTATFTDVSKDMWCFDYVEYVADEGYFKGTTATTFNPAGTMTRQQFVTVLARMAGVKVDNSKTAFTDVPAGSYSAGSVAWAAKEGIVTGYADGTFHPTAPVTRQQMCAFMSRFMNYYAEAKDVYFLKKATVSTFADYNQVADYAKSDVDRCRAYGLIQGYAEDNTFRPAASATRAHVAAVIYRLAHIIEMAAGGSPGSNPNPDPTTYTLTYVSNPLGTEKRVPATNTTGIFTAKPITEIHTDAAEYDGKVFLDWTDGTENYAAGSTITVKPATTKTVTANWADEDDLLYLAINGTANYIMGKTDPKVGELNNVVNPYASLDTLTFAAPSTIDAQDNSRTISINAEAALSTDIISRLIETATYYAVTMIGAPSEFVGGSAADKATQADAITITDLEQLVEDLLDIIDPNEIWWSTGDRLEETVRMAEKVYEILQKEGEKHVGILWDEYYVNENGTPLYTEVALVDGNDVIVTVKSDDMLYDGNTQLTYEEGLTRIAEAAAEKLYESLLTQTTYQTDLALSGKLALSFTMNTADGIAAVYAQENYPTTYHVDVNLKLVQSGEADYLAYKFVNGRPYLKLIVNTKMQADYEQSVNAIAEAAMTNKDAKAFLKNAVMSKLDEAIASMPDLVDQIEDAGVAADGEAYIKSKLSAGVDNWIEENMDTRASGNAPYYLPFDFFWTLDGKVDANGKILPGTGIDTTRHLFNNDDLTTTINGMVEEVIAKVLENTYGIVLSGNQTLNDAVKEMIEGKINSFNVADYQNQILTASKNEVEKNLKDLIDNGVGFVAPEIAQIFEQAFGCTVTNPSTNPKVTGLTIAGIDAFLVSTPNTGSTTRDETLTGLQTFIKNKITAEVDVAMNDVLQDPEVNALIGGNAAAKEYLKSKVLNRLGFVQTYPAYSAADENTIIADLVNAVKASYGVDAESLNATLETEISKAAGAYSGYLNEIGAARTFDKMFDAIDDAKLGDLADLLRDPAILDEFSSQITPEYVKAIADAIAAIEGNPSSITINGVTASGASNEVKAVKNAANGRAMCLAVANFLDLWSDLGIAAFADADGVAIDVVASAEGYTVTGGANFVIEVL